MVSEIKITISIGPEGTRVTMPEDGIESPVPELPPPQELVEETVEETGLVLPPPERVEEATEEGELIPPPPEWIEETEEAARFQPPSIETEEEMRQSKRPSRNRRKT